MKLLSVALLILILTSCRYAPERQLSQALEKTTDRYLQVLKREESANTTARYHYTWSQALEAMYKKNKSCLQSTYRLEDAESSERQIWRSFIPGLSAGVSDTARLDELGTLFTDPTFSVNSFIAFGNLVNLPKNIYTRKLGVVAAELGEQSTMRMQTIALHKLFQERKLLELEGEAYALSQQLITGMHHTDPTEGAKAQTRLNSQRDSWEEREEAWFEKIADFFNMTPGSVRIIASTAPTITYHQRELDFYDTQRWGKLQLKLLALQELGEDGQLKEAYARYLPTPSLTVSAPSLYSNTGNTDFDVNDIRLTPRASWRLDTLGSISRQIKRLKRNKPLQEWERQRRLKTEVQRMLEGREELIKTESELQEIRIARREYATLLRAGLVDQSPQQVLENLQGLYREEMTLQAQIVTISSGYWLIDEEWWTKHQRPWKD